MVETTTADAKVISKRVTLADPDKLEHGGMRASLEHDGRTVGLDDMDGDQTDEGDD